MGDYIIKRADSDDSLQHFGIKGQKWGVRRYENEDGTLTEAGKKRYAKALKVSQREKISKEQMQKNALKRGAIGGTIGALSGGIGTYDPDKVWKLTTYVGMYGSGIPSQGYTINSTGKTPGKGFSIENTAIGFVAGFAGTAVGSVIKDSVHNKRIRNAEKFIVEHQEAIDRTYGTNK